MVGIQSGLIEDEFGFEEAELGLMKVLKYSAAERVLYLSEYQAS